MKTKSDAGLQINPANHLCSKFNLQSLATFPIVSPGESGMRVIDDCAEEHIM